MLQTFEDAWRFARAVHASGTAPSSMNTVEKIFIAIESGAEVGLPPMKAVQSIAVINGRPSLWGDALPGVILGSGKCEYIDEFMQGEGEDRTAVCQAKRKNGKQVTRTFSVKDAKKAGLWNKSGPWTSYPDRMLQMRARAFCLRDAFADVLCGVGVAEEQMDIPQDEPRRVIEQGPNDANYCALLSTLVGKCGCLNENDNDACIRMVSPYGGLDSIKGNEAACGEVLKSLEGRHEEIAADLEQRRKSAA